MGRRSRPWAELDRCGRDKGVSWVALILPDTKGDDTRPRVVDWNDETGVGDESTLDWMNTGDPPRLLTELVEQRPRNRVPMLFREGAVLCKFDK